jgi:hypothetical protein
MWQKALDRQYNIFTTILMFLITGLSIVGTILFSTKGVTLAQTDKFLISAISILLSASIIAIIRMAHIERQVAFITDTPKSSGNSKIQNEENVWRGLLEKTLCLTVILLMILINCFVWSKQTFCPTVVVQ